jgi:hypothetical protein
MPVCAVWPHRLAPLSSSPPRQRRTDKRPPCHLHARPLPLRCHCCAFLHAQACLLYRRAVISLSLSPCTGPRCPHAIRGYKRDLPRACCPRLWFHHPPVPKQLPEAWPEHPITLEQLPEAWLTSLTTGAARHHRHAPVSFTPSVARLPCFELELSTMSGRFSVHLGWSR